jgi:hypothetical protein
MCLAVYIASDAELPLIRYERGVSAISVDAFAGDYMSSWPRRQHVVYACAFGRCGCGFLAHRFQFAWRRGRTRQALDGLADYIDRVANEADLDVIACWLGDEDEEELRFSGEVTPDFFRCNGQPFDAAHDRPILYTVRRVSALL